MNEMTKDQNTEFITKVSRGSNQSGMRAHNERLVLTLIRQLGPLAKAEIARITGLSAQTVSVIMRALEQDGLLKKGKPVRGKVGQPSVPMALAADGAYFFGLKVGRRSLDLILIDFLGTIIDRRDLTHRYPTPDSVVSFANQAIKDMLSDLGVERSKRVAGLGIAIPFRLWEWGKALGIEAHAMADWRERNISEEIALNWNFPVYLCNDASAACGAELVFGQRDNLPDFQYFFIGFFVGGGLVLDNRLYTGRSGNAAALGTMPIPTQDGSACQLIDVASLATLEQALIQQDQTADTLWKGEHWEIAPPLLNHWLTTTAEALAHAILSSACLIDFEAVIIDGWMPEAIRADLVAQTNIALSKLSSEGIELPFVQEGSIGRNARALGAASLPLSERFLVDKNAFQNT